MRWVDQATCRPFRCAVVPYVGNGSGHSFIDTGQDLDLEHVYISDAGAEVVAQMLGWSPPHELRQAQAQIADLEQRLALAEAELSEADKFEQSARYTLERFGEKPRNKPGRKPNKKEEDAHAVR